MQRCEARGCQRRPKDRFSSDNVERLSLQQDSSTAQSDDKRDGDLSMPQSKAKRDERGTTLVPPREEEEGRGARSGAAIGRLRVSEYSNRVVRPWASLATFRS